MYRNVKHPYFLVCCISWYIGTNPTMATPLSEKYPPASISDWSVTHVTPTFDSMDSTTTL